MQDLEVDLFPGSKIYKRLAFIVTLLHNKVGGNWTDHSFSMLLETLPLAFNFDSSFISRKIYVIKKYTKMLGLDYSKMDACVNQLLLTKVMNCWVQESRLSLTQGDTIATNTQSTQLT